MSETGMACEIMLLNDQVKQLRKECERKDAALRFAREHIAEDRATMNAIAKIFAAQGGDTNGKLAAAIKMQDKADVGTFAIIDSALTPARET